MYDLLESYGADAYITECGEVYAIKKDLDYSYLDNQIDHGVWENLLGYGGDGA
jgi:hypothetical protein